MVHSVSIKARTKINYSLLQFEGYGEVFEASHFSQNDLQLATS